MKLHTNHILKLTAGILIASIGVMTATAASLTSVSDTLSTVKDSANANHNIFFVTPTGVAGGQTIIVTLPAGFTASTTLDFTDIDVLVNGANVTLAAAPAGATWGAVRTSATVITLTNGTTAVTAGSNIRILIGTNATNQTTGVRQIQNATAGSYVIGITGTFTDTGSSTVTILANDTVAVSAVVQQSISFSISSNSINFGNLNSGAARFASSTGAGDATETTAHTLAVATNAPFGYALTVMGQTLTSQQNASNTIPAIGAVAASSTVGTSQFGLRATASGGTGFTVAAPYSSATSYGYGATATTSSTLATGTGATNTTTYALRYVANINGLQEAGSYSANLVYVATANY